MDGQKKKQLDKKKYVRYQEGAEMYSMGLSKFQQIAKDAKAAGAVYKIGKSQGSTVLIRLDIFDDYMEQFREEMVEMKHPLWKED